MARRRPRDDDDDDYEDDDRDDRGYEDDDEDDAPRKPKARNNAWTGLLALSLFALIAASVLFYLDAEAYAGTIPQPESAVKVPALGVAPTNPGR